MVGLISPEISRAFSRIKPNADIVPSSMLPKPIRNPTRQATRSPIIRLDHKKNVIPVYGSTQVIPHLVGIRVGGHTPTRFRDVNRTRVGPDSLIKLIIILPGTFEIIRNNLNRHVDAPINSKNFQPKCGAPKKAPRT